jgi:uncharacterized DUF497 family protein
MIMTIQFEWDEAKNKSNRSKHGIWFEEARSVFADAFSRVLLDEEHSDAEDRFLIVGMSAQGNLLMVVHCYRNDDIIRLISARKATKSEAEFYEKRI